MTTLIKYHHADRPRHIAALRPSTKIGSRRAICNEYPISAPARLNAAIGNCTHIDGTSAHGSGDRRHLSIASPDNVDPSSSTTPPNGYPLDLLRTMTGMHKEPTQLSNWHGACEGFTTELADRSGSLRRLRRENRNTLYSVIVSKTTLYNVSCVESL